MIRLIGPNCYGICNAAGYWLAETSYGLQWAMPAHGRQLLFETRERAEKYLSWLTSLDVPAQPMLGEGI